MDGMAGLDRLLERTVGTTRIAVDVGDITTVSADAIVNAANEALAGGGGVDGAIHAAGGPAIMADCRRIGHCPTGAAVITTGGNLPSRHVIHTVGPIWRGGTQGESELLDSCYCSCLQIAMDRDLVTVAFPSISTGVYGYPVYLAAPVAMAAIAAFAGDHPGRFKELRMVAHSGRDGDIYASALAAVTS